MTDMMDRTIVIASKNTNAMVNGKLDWNIAEKLIRSTTKIDLCVSILKNLRRSLSMDNPWGKLSSNQAKPCTQPLEPEKG